MQTITILESPHKSQYAVLQAIIRPCETGGYWAEIPALHCNTDGETLYEVEINMYEAVLASIDDYSEINDYVIEFEVRSA